MVMDYDNDLRTCSLVSIRQAIAKAKRAAARVADNEKDFRAYAIKRLRDPAFRARAINDLRGKDLLCWCIQDGPKRQKFCHARVWLDLVNQ